jgi:HSP90 family molecular chaperone
VLVNLVSHGASTADDLPLNVSRETLQNTRFLRQLQSIITRRLIQMIQRIAKEDPEKYADIYKQYGGTLKLGAFDDKKNAEKLYPLLRFATNQRNFTSLDEVGIFRSLVIFLDVSAVFGKQEDGSEANLPSLGHG